MFRIRKISNPFLDSNKGAIENVKYILSKQFPDISEEKIKLLDEQLINLLKFMSDLKFCFLVRMFFR